VINFSSKKIVEMFCENVLAVKLCWFRERRYLEIKMETNDKHRSFENNRVTSESYFWHNVNTAISNF
jgi:hypothetical protein